MADTPTPRSYPQILGEIMDGFTSRSGIRRLKVGGPLLSMMEATAQADVRNSQDTFNLLESRDLDNADTTGLQRIGRDEQIPWFGATKATGQVTITDTSFAKLASRIYQGTAAPIVGTTALNVEDAALWPAAGQVYLGRGTPNVEGPLAYSAKTNNGAYWTLTLAAPTTRFHNKGEGAVLAQGGNRLVDAGTVVATPQGALAAAVQFAVVYPVVLPDGEVEAANVLVLATTRGAVGNVPAGTVSSFTGGAPFPGAAVTNPKPFVTGRDAETNDAYRERIRKVRNSRQRGTPLALENAVLGIASPDDAKRVTSSALVRRPGEAAVLYIDDGTGYEETTAGAGVEVVVDNASGGEDAFATLYRPVAKAFLESINQAPFRLEDGMQLAVAVGGVTTTHSFDASEFVAITAASAYEVAASINAAPGLNFMARTTDSGTRVALVARAEENEDLEVVPAPTGRDAATVLQLPAARRYTALLYRNDRLLSKDGRVAAVRSLPFASWNAVTGAQTLTVAVDQTPAVTYTVTDQDFVDAGTGYSGVGKNSLAAWAAVLNRKIPGLTCAVEGDRLVLTSNAGRTATAGVSITGGGLVANLVFPVATAAGAARDYVLDRGTGQVATAARLAAGDRLTFGTTWTRAFLETGVLPTTTLPSPGTLWFVADGAPVVVPHGVGPGTPLTATVEQVTEYGTRIRIEAGGTTEAFANVRPGDHLVLTDPDTDLPAALRTAFRVIEVTTTGGLKNGIVVEKRGAAMARTGHAAAALAGGLSRVLVCGGCALDGGATVLTRQGRGVLASAEIFDPNTGAWSAAAPMGARRTRHTATALNDGRVLVAGGFDATGTALTSTEIYDPSTNTWAAGPALAVARADHSATLLASGRVLIAGGWNGTTATATAVEFDPGTNTLINATAMAQARFGHAAVRLGPTAGAAAAEANNVLVLGGVTAPGLTKLASVERYAVGAPGWAAKAAMPSGRAFFGAGSPSAQKVVVIGDGDPTTHGLERQTLWARYAVDTNSWVGDTAISGGGFTTHYADKAVVTTAAGRVLALYGRVVSAGSPTALRHLRYNDGTNAWDAVAASSFGGAGVEKMGVVGVALSGVIGVDKVLAFGGSATNNRAGTGAAATASHEVFDAQAGTWSYPEEATGLAAGTLANRGITFVRTARPLQRAVLAAAAGYTAAAWAQALNGAGLGGITAATYRTSRLRVSTASHGTAGDLLLAASTATAQLPLPAGTPEANRIGHLASVVGGSGLGTPDGFTTYPLAGTEPPHTVDAARTAVLGGSPGPYTATVVPLRRWQDGVNPTHWASVPYPVEQRVAEWGNPAGAPAKIATQDALGTGATRLGLRRDPAVALTPNTPVVLALPYAVGPQDDLTVVVDQDTETKRFVIPMARRLLPVGSYGTQVALRDVDGGATALQNTFGAAYDFNDHALFMRARAKTHSGTAAKRLLWRYYRHGAEGNAVALRYMLPAAPAAAPTVVVDHAQDTAFTDLGGTPRLNVHVVLGSGAAKAAATLRTTTRVGLSRTNGTAGVYDVTVAVGFSIVEAQRPAAGGLTRLRLQVPNAGSVATGAQGTGIQVGDTLYLTMGTPSPTTLLSGAFVVAQVDAFNGGTGQQDVYVPANTLHDGTSAMGLTATPGNVSADSAGEAKLDVTVTAGDLVRLSTPLPASYRDNTGRVLAAGPQYVVMRQVDATTAGPSGVLSWTTLANTAALQAFGGPTQTAAALAAAVNAVATSPVTATATGTGTGVIDRATWDELNGATAYYQLADGLNHVQRTVVPGSPVDETQFVLRDGITADLLTDSDWANEDVRIAPLHTDDVVAWLRTPAVSGLFTAAEVAAAQNGTAVQIASLTAGSAGAVEVQGGTAVLATAAVAGAARLAPRTGDDGAVVVVRAAEATGLLGGRWVRVDNAATLPKAAFWNSATTVSAVTAAGRWALGTAPYSVLSNTNDLRVEVERVGPYVAVHFPKGANSTVPTGLTEQTYLYLTAATAPTTALAQLATANRGVHRVLRVADTTDALTAWIEAPAAVEEVAVCRAKVLTADSMVPGDVWAVSTDRFGTGNKTTWVVTEVGAATPGAEQYADASFVVDTTTTPAAAMTLPTTFGADAALVQHREGVPARLVKRVVTVAPNQDDATYADVQLDTAVGYGKISAGAGSVLTALDKLAFPPGVFVGVDGYAYNTGLLEEANRVVYGDPDDEATYPGYAAAGATVLTAGPFVKRVKVALALRVQSGLASDDIAGRVKSAVATAVNQAGIGEAIAISDLVNAAASVAGVVAVSVVSPTYSSTADVIAVAPQEKPLVLDLDADVTVSFVGA